tara:strand:+ start:1150 stop:1554 length:405 start_codon:yes stop_codon:yes gene_type:complete
MGFSNSLFISKQTKRRFPLQAGLHVVLDGALLGIVSTVAIMSSVALHSQYLWTKSFTKLEITRDLNRRLLESTSILESYLLKNQKMSGDFVPAKAGDLVYVARPNSQNDKSLVKETFKKRLFKRISSIPVKSGY